MRVQRGFTLLELMVAMAIFAMLAVAGWQVFDSVNRARERAQFHSDNLAVLQYAYLQLQQDMGQIIPYQAPSTQNINTATNNVNDDASDENKANDVMPEPFISLDGEHVSFVRFADPDPRYQNSASVQRIEYIFADERLIRRQYTSVAGGRDSVSLDSVLLKGISAGRWQAYLPEMRATFPYADSNKTNTTARQADTAVSSKPEAVLLPKGIAINFTYQDMPITWQWALAPQPIAPNSPNISDDKKDNSNGNNGSGNNDNGNSGNGNNNAINDGNSTNNGVANAN